MASSWKLTARREYTPSGKLALDHVGLVLALLLGTAASMQRTTLLREGWAGADMRTWTGQKGWEISDNQSKEAAARRGALEVGRDALGWHNPARDGERRERLTWVQDTRKAGHAGGRGSRLRSHCPSGPAAGGSDRRMSALMQAPGSFERMGRTMGRGPQGSPCSCTSGSGLGPGLNLAVYPLLLPFPAPMAGGYSKFGRFLSHPSCFPFPRDGNAGMIWRLEMGQNRVASWSLLPQSVMLGQLGERSRLRAGDPGDHVGQASEAGLEQGHPWGEWPWSECEREVEGKAEGTGSQPGLLVIRQEGGGDKRLS